MDKLIFNLPGDWTSPYLLIRLLEVVGCSWTATPDGFGDLETGELVSLGYGAPVSDLGQHFGRGTDASRNPLTDEELAAIDAHRGIFQIQADAGPDPIQALRTALRAANAVVDGGATAVQCVNSGLVHGPDSFQVEMKTVEAAGDDPAALKAALYRMVVRYQFGKLPMTFGMATLGLPDVVLPEPVVADRAIGKLERAALSDDLLSRAEEDRRGLPDHLRNPYGMVLLSA